MMPGHSNATGAGQLPPVRNPSEGLTTGEARQRATPAHDHVIRIDREGTAPRWVRSLSRTEAGCTVTFDPQHARRMSEPTARKHAERLAPMAKGMRAELVVEQTEAAQ